MRRPTIEAVVVRHPMTAARVLEVLARALARHVAARAEYEQIGTEALLAFGLLRTDRAAQAQIVAQATRATLDISIPVLPICAPRVAEIMNPTTTLAEIRKHEPCGNGWKTALRNLGPDLDAPMSLGDIAQSNGAEDALWCVRALDWRDVAVRRAVVSGVVLPAVRRAHGYARMKEPEFVADLARWAAGDDAVNLPAVEDAAWAAARAARAAAGAALTAARAAAEAAAEAAAWTARAAARVAEAVADAAACAAAEAARAAGSAARNAERAAQLTDIVRAFPPLQIKSGDRHND